MTAFFRKYKWTILYWTFILFLLLYFSPRQRKYYLDQDIEHFKTLYLIPALCWTFGLLAMGLYIFWLGKTKSVKQPTLWFLSTAFISAIIIFVFQDIFLVSALFLNRQFVNGKIEKIYKVHYLEGADNTINNFIPYDIATKKSVSLDRKLQNELYKAELRQNDTVLLQLNKGLFGIAFKATPFND